MWRAPLLAVIIVLSLVPALAADRKGTRFWNLTLHTIVSLQVDHDERLRITGIEPGRYDVRLKDKSGRICTVRNVDVKDGAIFTIEEKDLADCGG
jgi:hypothetical protein